MTSGLHSFLRSRCNFLLCVTCHWGSCESWQPCEGVTSTVSHPQEPCSAPVISSLWLLLWSDPSHIFFLFSYCLLFFPALLSFPKNPKFLWCAQSRTVLSFMRPAIFQAYFSPGPTCPCFWQSRISYLLQYSITIR